MPVFRDLKLLTVVEVESYQSYWVMRAPGMAEIELYIRVWFVYPGLTEQYVSAFVPAEAWKDAAYRKLAMDYLRSSTDV